MDILERHIKHILPGKQAERVALAKEIHAVESKYGFPPAKRFILYTGADTTGSEILERQWPSLAVMESAMGQAMSDPAWQALNLKLSALSRDDLKIELYWVADWS